MIGSLGDSITTATNAKGWGERKDINWSTGTRNNAEVKSHFHKLKELLGEKVIAVNVAKAGSTSSDLAGQVTKLLKSNPDYVTVLMGANDVCGWSDNHAHQLSAYKARVQNVIERLVAHNSQIKIVLVPVPDMYHLWKLGSNSSCQFLWDLANVCTRLLHSRTSNAERLRFKEQLNDLNESLQELSRNFAQHVRFDLSLAQYKFAKQDVSKADCFHPSLKGQNLISELTWKHGWYGQ